MITRSFDKLGKGSLHSAGEETELGVQKKRTLIGVAIRLTDGSRI
jgi:hypothetical protein